MINPDALYIPDASNHGDRIWVSKSISAIQLLPTEEGGAKLGLLSHLGPGVMVEICGNGFDERTAKVRAHSQYYFVFWQDLESQAAASGK
jgi:hypothetical protein